MYFCVKFISNLQLHNSMVKFICPQIAITYAVNQPVIHQFILDVVSRPTYDF